MTKREFSIVRRLAEKRYHEERNRREASLKEEIQAVVEDFKAKDPDLKALMKRLEEARELEKKIAKKGVSFSRYREYGNTIPETTNFEAIWAHKIQAPKEKALQKWAAETWKKLQDLLDETELASAGIEATEAMAKITEILGIDK